MSDPIRAGDLVQIIRKFCEEHDDHGLGRIYVVESIEPAFDFGCRRCRDVRLSNGELLAYGDVGKGYGFYPVSCLRRIPPLSELEDVKQDEVITA